MEKQVKIDQTSTISKGRTTPVYLLITEKRFKGEVRPGADNIVKQFNLVFS